MANPLFNGMQNAPVNASGMANALGNVNPQALQNIMNMINRGADLKDIVVAFKKSGMSPQVAEKALCMTFPQLKQIKGQMDNMKQSGISQQDMFADFAKKANIDPNQLNTTYNNLMKLVK